MDGDKWKEAGEAHYRTGAYAEALEAFANARTAYDEAGDQASAAEILSNQGVVYRMLRQWNKAEKAFLEARDAFAHLGDTGRQAQATANLGMLANSKGWTKQAISYLEVAIAAFQAQGDGVRASDTWRALSRMYLKQGRWLDAVMAYSSALDCLPSLSLGQRFLRWLFRIPLRLLGAG